VEGTNAMGTLETGEVSGMGKELKLGTLAISLWELCLGYVSEISGRVKVKCLPDRILEFKRE
jgi:hypothetical protein